MKKKQALNPGRTKDKIFTIRLSNNTYEELQTLAATRDATVADLIRMFIRLGMLVASDASGDPKLMFKDGDELRQVLLV